MITVDNDFVPYVRLKHEPKILNLGNSQNYPANLFCIQIDLIITRNMFRNGEKLEFTKLGSPTANFLTCLKKPTTRDVYRLRRYYTTSVIYTN